MTNTAEDAGRLAELLMGAVMTIANRVTPLPWWRAVLVALLMSVGMTFIGMTFLVTVIAWKTFQTGCAAWIFLMGDPSRNRQPLAGVGGAS